MNISVLSPDREIFRGVIQSVKVPGVTGQFEILAHHAPLVSALGDGNVRIRKSDGTDMSFRIKKGFIEVLYNKISLLVQGAEELQG